MAYQARRKQIYTEQFELVDYDGTVAHTLQVELDADVMVKQLSEKHIALVKALNDVGRIHEDIAQNGQSATEENYKIVGHAVADLMEACFGRENAIVILDFYKDRYIEITKEVLPFITKVVIPQVRAIANDNKKKTLNSFNRKQRRNMFKGR